MKEFYIDCDGIRLHSKLEKPEGLDKCPLCILIHGFTGQMEEDHLLAVQDAMVSCGVAVLRVEMYGHGKSDGEFKNHTLYKWIANALAVVKYAKKLNFVTDLYLSGHSQGGLLTILVGGMCNDDFKAIIPLSPALCIPVDARKGSMLGAEFDPIHIPETIGSGDWELSADYVRVAQTIHPEDEIARYEGPVLIIHGTDDETVPFSYAEQAQKLYKNAKLVAIKGDDHCFTRHVDKLAETVRDFFSK
ncbi:MAG: alpha/beta fold hydrolase [Treponema sp.]|uniref:alpha/beta hydrolase family protein n=1 Tax=Treponema sp. TaxID=166 RepID=UPI00298E980E|nr:alpha/beta fold hydrolase [Treponema sp.]MCR5385591.1 alpha/beta fold hydrolase [Treponema sp.]